MTGSAEATAAYAQLMARYNAWQNREIISALNALDEVALRRDRGAFFGSIFSTLNHILWADRVWMKRFAGTGGPRASSIAESVDETDGWNAFAAERAAMDGEIANWSVALTDEALAGELTWYSGASGRKQSRSLAALVVHLFNHQTHHRGQVHAMMTAAGLRAATTDLFLMPDEPV